MKAKFIIISYISLLIGCNDNVKDKQLENQNQDNKTNNVNTKVKVESHIKNDTINFVDKYLLNSSNKSISYLRNENIVNTLRDSLEVEKVTETIILNRKEVLLSDEINYDDKFFIDFENFTISFIPNEDSELFCAFKRFDILKDVILINIYLNDSQQVCIINKKQKSFQLIKGEVSIFDNDLILISNNNVDYSSFKIYKIVNDSILCWKSFYSIDNAFYDFYKDKKKLTFLSTTRDVTTKYSLDLN